MITHLEEVERRLRPLEGMPSSSGTPRYFFRGQNKVHPKVSSTFARIPENNTIEIAQAYTAFRNAKHICSGLRGYHIGHLDGLAIMQHYGWPSPLIDLTGTLDVAIFFALLGAHPGETAVIYVIDRERLPDNITVIDHDFLTHEFGDGGLRHRWLRQDGFAITPVGWRDALVSRSFNLLDKGIKPVVSEHPFEVSAGDRAAIPDLLDKADDPIPEELQRLLHLFCQHQFQGEVEANLAAKINDMWP
jgi:hypothetical protein